MKRTLLFWMWIMAVAISFAAPGQDENPATFEKESRYEFDATVERIRDAASDAGWVLPGDLDMQATLKKGGKEVL